MRSRLAAFAVAAVAVAAVPSGAGLAGSPIEPAAAIAKTCSPGFKHAVINGAEKCLRRGEFCARATDRQYRRYGYRCTKRDARGNYHLTLGRQPDMSVAPPRRGHTLRRAGGRCAST
jgi:hypothetical protein